MVAAQKPAQATECSSYASIPLPPEAAGVTAPTISPVCASYRSYRGIGRRVDYAQARACAWQERDAHSADLPQNPKEITGWVVGGPLILADIYFNGAGVPRNVPLAMRFACEFEEASAKLVLDELAQHPPQPGTRFEFCDYAATTFTGNFCAGYAAEISDDRRRRFEVALQASMPAQQQAAFRTLRAARDAYILTHAREVDQSGTIRVVRTIGSEQILSDLFHTELLHFERKHWPTLSQEAIINADAALNRALQATMGALNRRSKEDTYEGAVTEAQVAEVQKAWERYRDAWAAFAALRYPTAASSIRAQIVRDRVLLLKTIR